MRILALDCATKTGWALGAAGTLIESGVQDFSLRRGESPGMRFVMFRRWLTELVADGQLDLVVYEQAHHRGGAPTEVGVGLATRVMEVAAEYNVEYATVHTATLKKFATGAGRCGKPEMIEAALKRWSIPILDDNHADALCMLDWAQSVYEIKAKVEEERENA